MSGWGYWLAFALTALVVLVAVPVCWRLERQIELERERRLWREMGGGRL